MSESLDTLLYCEKHLMDEIASYVPCGGEDEDEIEQLQEKADEAADELAELQREIRAARRRAARDAKGQLR